MGFVRDIGQNTLDSHQSSPGYVITVLRWSNRDTFNYDTDPLAVRTPLVIYNDAIQVTTTNSKKGLSPSMTAVLKGGDLNYATAIAPGDYVFVNMLNWQTDAERVRTKAVNLQPINEYGDGFKGIYKVQSVRKNIKMHGDKKILTFTLHAAGFTEFNNVIYFNPAIAAAFQEVGTQIQSLLVGTYYQDKLNTQTAVQDIMGDLFEILIGKSRRSSNTNVRNFGEVNFRLPIDVGRLLGRPMEHAADLFNYIIGIWGEQVPPGGVGTANPQANTNDIGRLFNPNVVLANDRPGFFKTNIPIQGNKLVHVENWNNITAWSILQSNLNNAINEMYTTYRVSPSGNVMPTVVVRQKPFTTEHFQPSEESPVTRFFSVPRWRISPTLLYSLDLGRDEAARMNFVQIYTRTLPDTHNQDSAQQIALQNFVIDEGDINRNGLRPYIKTANFDFPIRTNRRLRARQWAEIIGDWVIDGHLRESGTLQFQGIQAPISVGDNLELDGVVYHIESIKNIMTISADGRKSFKTTISVSFGTDLRSNSERPVYPEMEHTDAQRENADDYSNERIRPGISDTQDIIGRPPSGPRAGEEVSLTPEESFTLNPRTRDRTTATTQPSRPNGSSTNPDTDDGEQ